MSKFSMADNHTKQIPHQVNNQCGLIYLIQNSKAMNFNLDGSD